MQPANNSRTEPAKFRFKNLGPIEEAELELGGLTIIAGRNNTGKTYMVYSLYGYLKTWRELRPYKLADTLIDNALGPVSLTVEELARIVLAEGRASWKVDREMLSRERAQVIRELNRRYSREALADVFNSSQDTFESASIEAEPSKFPEKHTFSLEVGSGTSISMEFDGSEIVLSYRYNLSDADLAVEQLRLAGLIPSFYLFFLVRSIPELGYIPFIFSAERFGISLFYKELDISKNRLVDLLQKMGDDKTRESLSPFDLIESSTGRYALPIKDNINFTRDLPNIQKERSDFYKDKLFDYVKNIMEGYYKSSDDEVRFISKARKQRSFNIPLHIASSSARGLSDLYFFLRHVATKNHLLFIDEPESHLDTANQVQFARLLARLVQSGAKVLVTTHSDYIVKEVNNLIMLSRSFDNKSKFVKKLKYDKDDFIDPGVVRAYVAERNSLTPCKIDQFGIDFPVFDKTIDDINHVSNELASRVIVEG
ncbi:MAG: AAA family ATPase [Caldilineaceae bacterium]|nr:AAA family ATPase [Caldilineaceae bacterium]